MDQQQFNPYAPQPEATSGAILYPGQDGQLQGQFANPSQQAYQPDYGMQQPMQAYPQQPYGVLQPDPAQAAWQQGAYPVQGQQPYGYPEPQQPSMPVQDSQQFQASVQEQPQLQAQAPAQEQPQPQAQVPTQEQPQIQALVQEQQPMQMPTQEAQPFPQAVQEQQSFYAVAQGQQPYQPPMVEQQPYPMQAQPQQPYPMTAQMPQPYQTPPTQQSQPMYGGPAPMPPAQDASGAQTRSGLAIAGMVIGIVSAVCSPMPFVNNFIFFLAIVGLVLSIIGLRGVAKNPARKGKGMAIAGIILSAVAIILVLASQAFYGAVLDEVSDQLNESTASYRGGPATTYTPSTSSSSDAGSGSGSPAAGSSSDSAEGGAASAASATQDLALGTAAAYPDGTTVTVVAATSGVADADGSTATQVTVTYENTGEDAFYFNKAYDWKAEDPQGVRRDVTLFFDSVDDLGSGELAAGGTVTGNIYFDEPISKVIYAPSLWSDANNVSWVIA